MFKKVESDLPAKVWCLSEVFNILLRASGIQLGLDLTCFVICHPPPVIPQPPSVFCYRQVKEVIIFRDTQISSLTGGSNWMEVTIFCDTEISSSLTGGSSWTFRCFDYSCICNSGGWRERCSEGNWSICICFVFATYVFLTVFAKVDESGSAAQWAEYLSYLDSMVEDGLLRWTHHFAPLQNSKIADRLLRFSIW